jgi:HEAT repeat protein
LKSFIATVVAKEEGKQMSRFSQKILIVAIAIAIAAGGIWYVQRGWVPEDPTKIRVDPEMSMKVYALLEKSITAAPCERSAILFEIRDMGYESLPVLVLALRDKDPRIRAFAANVLQYSGNLSVAPHLVVRLNDENAIVRRTALVALGSLGAVETVPAILVVLNDKDNFTRCQAALVLGTLGQDKAVSPLIKTLGNDPYPVARQVAATSLGEIGSESAVPPLIDSLDDENYLVRTASLVALNRITGENMGTDTDAWKSWLNARQPTEKLD